MANVQVDAEVRLTNLGTYVQGHAQVPQHYFGVRLVRLVFQRQLHIITM